MTVFVVDASFQFHARQRGFILAGSVGVLVIGSTVLFVAWLLTMAFGTFLVILEAPRLVGDRERRPTATLGAAVTGLVGATLLLVGGGRRRSEDALASVGALAPGFVMGHFLARLLDVPLGFSLLLGLAFALAGSAIILDARSRAAMIGIAVDASGVMLVLTPIFAYVAPHVNGGLALGSLASWALLSLGLAMSLFVVMGLHAFAHAPGARSNASFETLAIAVVLIGAGFGVASPSGALRATEASIESGCAPMGSMAGMSMGMGAMMSGACSASSTMRGMDMRPVETQGAFHAAVTARGNVPLNGTLVAGVQVYELRAAPLRWSILPDVQVGAYAYNDMVAGPLLMLRAGQNVSIQLTNALPENTSLHLHGLQIPNSVDGVPYLDQRPIMPGARFDYNFTVPDTPGTYFYHSHSSADRQQALGLYGGLVIKTASVEAGGPVVDETILLGEWTLRDGTNIASMSQPGMEPNYFTMNGKAYPETDSLRVKVGDLVRLRVVGSGQFIHPMHLHGQPFRIVATDGNPVPSGYQLVKDTVLVGPGERYDLEFNARAPGTWLFHCHINDHTTNNGSEVDGGGGLMMKIIVEE